MTDPTQNPQGTQKASAIRGTANDRFKQKFTNWLWSSVCIATVVHFGIFFFWPNMSAADVSFTTEEVEAVELPPEVEIPPPPEQIARPATPVVAEADVDEDVTIESTTFEDNPVDDLPPPPDSDGSLGDNPTFTPYEVAPELKNQRAVQRALQRHYPPLLRDAGVGGNVLVWFFIDENGRVQDTQIKESSGHESMDQAALKVADLMEFSPALNRDKRVPVWVAIPVTFATN